MSNLSTSYDFKYNVPTKHETDFNVCKHYYTPDQGTTFLFGKFVYCNLLNTTYVRESKFTDPFNQKPLNYVKRSEFRLVYVTPKRLVEILSIFNYTGSSNYAFNAVEATKRGLIDGLLYPMAIDDSHTKETHISPVVEVSKAQIYTVVPRHSSGLDRYNILGLSPAVWIGTALTVVLLPLCAFIINRLQYKITETKKKDSIVHFFWVLFSDLLQNAQGDLGRNFRGFFIYGAFVLSSTVLMKAFSGNLKSELMISKTDYINSFEDILKKPSIRPAICTETKFFSIFLEDFSPINVKMQDRMDINGLYFEFIHDIKDDFLKGKLALIQRGKVQFDILPTLSKDSVVYTGTEKYAFGSAHFIFNRGLPRHMKERLDYLSTRYVETDQKAQTTRYSDFQRREAMSFEKPQLNEVVVLKVGFLLPVFVLWFYGIFASIVVMLLEVAYFFIFIDNRKM